MSHTEPFYFFTERRLVELTGMRARNLEELRTGVEVVAPASIFYHTHHQFLSHHFEKPVVYNDFSMWVGEALQDEALSERLGVLDLLEFTTIHELREAVLLLIGQHLDEGRAPLRQCPPGDEFHFCKSKSFIMPLGLVATDVPDFFVKLHRITNVSLYFHFLEARLRLGRPANDFSQWLEWRGEPELAVQIAELDPYSVTLDELRNKIIEIGSSHGRV